MNNKLQKASRHDGVNCHRLYDNPSEQAYADRWKDEQKSNLLGWLMNDRGQESVSYSVSERDELVAATVIQWLGSSVGQYWVKSVQAEIEDK